MSRTIIADIDCGFCGKRFDVATEDLDWEQMQDYEESEQDSCMRDFGIQQNIACPYCGKESEILVHFVGKSKDDPELTFKNLFNYTFPTLS